MMCKISIETSSSYFAAVYSKLLKSNAEASQIRLLRKRPKFTDSMMYNASTVVQAG